MFGQVFMLDRLDNAITGEENTIEYQRSVCMVINIALQRHLRAEC